MRTVRATRLTLLLALVTALLVAAGCGGEKKEAATTAAPPAGAGAPADPASLPLDPGNIANVNGQQISQAAFDNLLGQAKASSGQPGQPPYPAEGSADFLDLKAKAVEYLVQNTEMAQKAQQMGITVDDAAIKQRFDQIVTQQFNGKADEATKQYKDAGLTQADVDDAIRNQLISQQLYDKVGQSAPVSDADVQAEYDKNKARYETPPSRDVRHILVKTKAKADQLRAQIEGGAKFEDLAKKFSTDKGSATQGGLLPGLQQGQTVPPFDKAAFSQKVGVVSQPIKTTYGYHLIKVVKIQPKQATPFAQVKDQIRQQLTQTRQSEAYVKFTDGIKAEYATKIRYADGYDPTALAAEAKKLAASTTTPAPGAPTTSTTEGTPVPSTTTAKPPTTSTAAPAATPKPTTTAKKP